MPAPNVCLLLDTTAQYVDGGWLGVKTGRGVFYYDPNAAEKTVEMRVAPSFAGKGKLRGT